MIDIYYPVSPKVIGFILLSFGLGLLFVFIHLSVFASLSVFFALIILLYVKLRWWAFILVGLIPFMGVKYPCLYLTTTGFDQSDAIPFLLLISFIPLLSLLIYRSVSNSRDAVKSPLTFPILLLVGYSSLTFLWSPANVDHNLLYFCTLMANISLFFFLFHIIDNQVFHRRLMWCLILSGIILSIQTFISMFISIQYPHIELCDWLCLVIFATARRTTGGGTGFFQAQQETGMVLAVVTLIAIGLLLTEKEKSKIWFLRFTIMLSTVSTFLAKSKSGIWALVMMTFFSLFMYRKLRKSLIRNSIVFLLLIVVIFCVSMQFARSRSSTKTSRAITVSLEEGTSLGKRLEYWRTGFEELRKRLLIPFGLGVGGYKHVTQYVHAHNLYLALFFDFGFIGIIFVCCVIFAIAKSFFTLAGHQETYLQVMSVACSVALIGLGLIGMVYIPYYMSFFWFVLALTSSTFSLAQKEVLMKNTSLNIS
ncbi:O-antigen ligase family protein [Planctomycetota bacterium]